jgi:hypothetical protein
MSDTPTRDTCVPRTWPCRGGMVLGYAGQRAANIRRFAQLLSACDTFPH